MGSPCDLLVVGLGNPGDRYDQTRHNVGADAARLLAERQGATLKLEKRLKAQVSELRLDDWRVVIAVPTTWMNESGQCVSALVRRYGIEDWSSLLVLHDELDLPPGRVKLKLGGGLAGHNGLRSITAHLHTQEYARVRIGVGKPPGGPDQGVDWVLSRVPKDQRVQLDVACEQAVDAALMILDQGIDAAMQQVNASN
ncbi:MAG: aminoacyl-tRNA hydrolase [Actinomycetes bacterium]